MEKTFLNQNHAPAHLPEFVTLKSAGGDTVTGMSRSWWYLMEREGRIKLVRIRRPGSVKARVLLPVQQAIDLIRKLSEVKDSATTETVAAR